MNGKLVLTTLWALTSCCAVLAVGNGDWWNPRWRFRTTVTRPGPYRDDAVRPVEVAVDFPLLLQRAGVDGEFDPASVRVVERRRAGGPGDATQVPFVRRTELDPETRRPRSYLAWMATPREGDVGRFDIYFETRDRGIPGQQYTADRLPPANLLSNPGFEEEAGGQPAGWTVEPSQVASLGTFEHSTGRQSLRITVGEYALEDTIVVTEPDVLSQVAEADRIMKAEIEQYGQPTGLNAVQLPEASGGRAMALGGETTGAAGEVDLEAGQYTLLVRAWGPSGDQDALSVVVGGQRQRRWTPRTEQWTQIAVNFTVDEAAAVPIALVGAEPGVCVDWIAVVRGTYATSEQQQETSDHTVSIFQEVDVRDFAGQEMLFECDLLAERAAYGLPVCIELEQFRSDGTRIPECAVQPRWLTLELAEGQLVQFRQRGRFSHQAATVKVLIRMRCYAVDADSNERIEGPDSAFTAWLDRVVVRPGERWPWPAATNSCFVEGAIPSAPVNRGFEFTGQRRLGFNGGSEATMTTGAGDHGLQAVHWGLQRGTLEFWCRPSWDADDGVERIFFTGYAYLYRLQSRLRKLGADGDNQLEFAISDSNRDLHTVRGPAPLQAGRWHHIAATWDHTTAHLQLFVDGTRVGVEGPDDEPWPSTLEADGPEDFAGQGIHKTDRRTIPMQAFIGGRMAAKVWPPGDAVEAVLDEFRISDVVRYTDDFTPQSREFAVDDNTRALWHFENERHGVHGGDDRFVRSYAGCELHPQRETVPFEVLSDGELQRRTVAVKPHAPDRLFEQNRGDRNLVDRWSRDTEVPDPRFVEYRRREVETTVSGEHDALTIDVDGDYEPLMRWVTFERADGAGEQTTLLPRWRANDNVVPFSVDSLAETLGGDAKTDAEKAFAAMQYVLDTTAYYDAHYCETLPSGRHRSRVSYVFLKALNVYPYDQCGPLNFTLRKLFLALGISSNDSPGTHHQFEQAYYDGDWRLYDLSSRVYWLERDNESVIGLREVGEDPFCKLRQPGNLNSYFPGRGGGPRFGVAQRPHNIHFPLRAGEEASICWQNEGRWFELTGDREPIPLAKIPPYFANGAIVYRPLDGGEATQLTNMSPTAGDDAAALQAQAADKAAGLVYRAECPYIFSDARVTGTYQAREPGTIILSLSFDGGQTWTEAWRNPDASGELAVGLREHVMARYAWWLKLAFAPGSEAEVTGLTVRSTFVVSPLSLPGALSLGANRITFVGGPVSVPVKTRCCWVERYDTDLGVSLNAISYYNLDHESHRNLYVVSPGDQLPVEVALHGRETEAEVGLEGLPDGWDCQPQEQRLRSTGPRAGARAAFTVVGAQAGEGQVHCFEVVVRDGDAERRIPVQVLVARAPLVREAEQADSIAGEASVVEVPELSGARGVRFDGDGELIFDFTAPAADSYVIWLRGRWDRGSRSAVTVQVDGGDAREVRTSHMIGFGDWTDPRHAYTKGFVHYPDEDEQWAWYRIAGPELGAGGHRLSLAADAGTWFDAVAVLPQTPAVDRAATNLFANWNFAPWDNPNRSRPGAGEGGAARHMMRSRE
ncbi:MAG: LamG domain-containing protein [Armatimonadota bacterium]|nr:LamG domain-containing protein [Armatimonadota bacterium]